MSFLSLMAATLPECALLVKLFYESKGNAAAALREFRRLKNLRKGPLLPQALKRMIAGFEKTGHLGVQPGRGRKSTSSDVVEDVATAIVDQSMDNVIGCSSVRAVSRHLGVLYSTVWNVLRKVEHFFPYKIRHNQQLMVNDREKRLTFALTFLARVKVDASWPWKILWSDEAHFHLSGTVNTHNCRIWDTESPRAFQEIPLHSQKVTVWCGFTATFILGPLFFEETTRNGPVTCTVTARRYKNMLENFEAPQMLQHQCLDSITFMQDGAPPHIGLCVQQFLRQHFTNDRVNSRAFPTAWPPRTPDLNPCDFWMWGYLKNLVYRGRLITLADLKDSITLHVRSISVDQLRSAVEQTLHRLQILHLEEGNHIEQHSLHRYDMNVWCDRIKCVTNVYFVSF
ncbi:uncharacterized protein TNCV_1131841 [Trichonephila clavipes]|nr:uncharacterized protein TNCV_1131841 [Trichonephila clavipes]